jgi:hypothetical protein
MIKGIFLIGFLFVYHCVHAQIDTIVKWNLIREISSTSSTVWTYDQLGNHYLFSRSSIQKIDSTGKIVFTQSIKQMGRVRSISPINAMKILLFSEEQQQVCVVDNTLAQTESCLTLSDLGFENVSLVCASSQADKVWLFDQVNFRLLQLNLSSAKTVQEISNLAGILSVQEVLKIREVNNELFLLEKSGIVFRFDMYGTLLDRFECPGATDFDVEGTSLATVVGKELHCIDIETDRTWKMDLPVEHVRRLEISGTSVCLQNNDKIFHYQVNFKH